MSDATELTRAIKKAAVAAVEASKPAEVRFGKVTSISPLIINIEQKLNLGEAQLLLTENVSDYEVQVDIDWETEQAGEFSHSHSIKGKKKISVHNGLKIGEQVLLLRAQGGQKYIVLDRIGERL